MWYIFQMLRYYYYSSSLKNVAISFQIHDNRELFLINSVAKHFKTAVLELKRLSSLHANEVFSKQI